MSNSTSHSKNIDLSEQRKEPFKQLASATIYARNVADTDETAFITHLTQSIVEALVYVGDCINMQTQTSVQMFQAQLNMQAQAHAQTPQQPEEGGSSGKVWTP